MIQLTKLNGKEFTLNASLIETVEESPDTVITMTTGKVLIVKESTQEITTKVIDYKRKYHLG